MIRPLRTGLLLALAALLLSGCFGWGHAMYGPHHGRWDDDRPYGPRSRCSDQQPPAPGQPPCPYTQ
ncbi:MAG TPA: hypothetical protein VKB51_19650 [bacterium]|nr:hypothetical protein [bacterium]